MNSRTVEIRELYKNYTPPQHVLSTVQALLDSVPDEYVSGLDHVVLTNGLIKMRRPRVLGRYHGKQPGRPPWVELYVNRIAAGTMGHAWIPFLRDLAFGFALFHEIEHHAHEDWGTLWENFMDQKYWYLKRVRRPFLRLLRVYTRSLR